MRFLNVDIKNVTEQELLQQLRRGVLITPNVDQMVKLQKDREFYEIVKKAEWVVCDSKILLLCSKLLGTPLKEEITQQEWQRLYGLMSKHTLIGIGYVAIQKLPREQWPPKTLVLQWTSVANGIRNRNMALNEECRSICEEFTHDGVESVVINEAFVGVNENDNENENCPQMTQMDTDGCPQADFEGEQLLINDERLMINDCPWLLCEPNEKEGKKLLAEIMQGGNFGQYDTRDAALKKGGMMKHGLWKLKRVMRLVSSYPEEALWEPVFRVYHLGWRIAVAEARSLRQKSSLL